MQKINFQNGQAPALSAGNLNQLQTYIEQAIADITLPVGVIQVYAGATAPTGFLLCNGSAISRTTYSDLFDVIGTTYGAGNGSTTFNLPNLKGKHPMGYDSTQTEFNALGKTGGEKKHTQTVDELVPHKHNVTSYTKGASGTVKVADGNYANVGNPVGDIVIGNTGGGQAFNVLDPYVVTNYIIKY